MKSEFRITIASPPDREKLVAEIFFGNEQWAELHQENGDLNLEIYPKKNGQMWTLGLDDVLDALLQARERLAGKH